MADTRIEKLDRWEARRPLDPVWVGRGDGTFTARNDFVTGNEPMSVAACDLNGDGMSDVAVANSSDNSVSVLLGHGDGDFGTRQDFSTAGEPHSVATADMDQDGKPDLAVAAFQLDEISTLLGTAASKCGTTSEREIVPTPW